MAFRGLAARAEIVSHFQEIYQGPPSETIPNLFQTFHEYISQEDAPGIPFFWEAKNITD